ncbi:MAG: hypothetical protein SFT68_04225 [Rickettsiaceae bacterium]|nr:hypothetical protein [Rickettsiaceae bacterium]
MSKFLLRLRAALSGSTKQDPRIEKSKADAPKSTVSSLAEAVKTVTRVLSPAASQLTPEEARAKAVEAVKEAWIEAFKQQNKDSLDQLSPQERAALISRAENMLVNNSIEELKELKTPEIKIPSGGDIIHFAHINNIKIDGHPAYAYALMHGLESIGAGEEGGLIYKKYKDIMPRGTRVKFDPKSTTDLQTSGETIVDYIVRNKLEVEEVEANAFKKDYVTEFEKKTAIDKNHEDLIEDIISKDEAIAEKYISWIPASMMYLPVKLYTDQGEQIVKPIQYLVEHHLEGGNYNADFIGKIFPGKESKPEKLNNEVLGYYSQLQNLIIEDQCIDETSTITTLQYILENPKITAKNKEHLVKQILESNTYIAGYRPMDYFLRQNYSLETQQIVHTAVFEQNISDFINNDTKIQNHKNEVKPAIVYFLESKGIDRVEKQKILRSLLNLNDNNYEAPTIDGKSLEEYFRSNPLETKESISLVVEELFNLERAKNQNQNLEQLTEGLRTAYAGSSDELKEHLEHQIDRHMNYETIPRDSSVDLTTQKEVKILNDFMRDIDRQDTQQVVRKYLILPAEETNRDILLSNPSSSKEIIQKAVLAGKNPEDVKKSIDNFFAGSPVEAIINHCESNNVTIGGDNIYQIITSSDIVFGIEPSYEETLLQYISERGLEVKEGENIVKSLQDFLIQKNMTAEEYQKIQPLIAEFRENNIKIGSKTIDEFIYSEFVAKNDTLDKNTLAVRLINAASDISPKGAIPGAPKNIIDKLLTTPEDLNEFAMNHAVKVYSKQLTYLAEHEGLRERFLVGGAVTRILLTQDFEIDGKPFLQYLVDNKATIQFKDKEDKITDPVKYAIKHKLKIDGKNAALYAHEKNLVAGEHVKHSPLAYYLYCRYKDGNLDTDIGKALGEIGANVTPQDLESLRVELEQMKRENQNRAYKTALVTGKKLEKQVRALGGAANHVAHDAAKAAKNAAHDVSKAAKTIKAKLASTDQLTKRFDDFAKNPFAKTRPGSSSSLGG